MYVYDHIDVFAKTRILLAISRAQTNLIFFLIATEVCVSVAWTQEYIYIYVYIYIYIYICLVATQLARQLHQERP